MCKQGVDRGAALIRRLHSQRYQGLFAWRFFAYWPPGPEACRGWANEIEAFMMRSSSDGVSHSNSHITQYCCRLVRTKDLCTLRRRVEPATGIAEALGISRKRCPASSMARRRLASRPSMEVPAKPR